MIRLNFSVFFILLLIGPLVSAQQTLHDLTLSSIITKGAIPYPIVVTNEIKNEWLVAWDQSGTVKGRIVKPDGHLRSTKTLVKGRLIDAIYDPIHHTYLILFLSRGSLRTQLFSGSLKKKGSSYLIELPSAGFDYQLIFDPVDKRFLAFWIEYTGQDAAGHYLTAIRSSRLDTSGKIISDVVTVLNGGKKVDYQTLRVTRNPENGNLFLRVYQFSKGVDSILGYTLKPDGTLLRATPAKFATRTVHSDDAIFSIPDAEFAVGGSGIAAWAVADQNGISPAKIKIRQLTGKGTFNSKPELIGEDNLHHLGTSIVFDRGQNVFLVLWDAQSSVDGVLLDANSAAILKGPFTISGSSGQRFEVGFAEAYEGSSNRILIVWASECFNPFSPECPGSVNESVQVSGVIFSSK